MVCLAALCTQAGVDMNHCAETELERSWKNVNKIRSKHSQKPKNITV